MNGPITHLIQLYLLGKGVQLVNETEDTVRDQLYEAGEKLHSLDKDLFDAREIFPEVSTTSSEGEYHCHTIT